MVHKTPLERIKSLLPALPPKDKKIGDVLYETRNFESLLELTVSAIKKAKRAKDDTVDYDGLNKLEAEVDYYINMLGIEDDDSWSDYDNI